MAFWFSDLSAPPPPSHVTIIIIRIQIGVHVHAITFLPGHMAASMRRPVGAMKYINTSDHSTSDERETLQTNEARYLRAE